MPSYRDALPEEDRWALSYYVLALSAYKDPLTARAVDGRGRGSHGARTTSSSQAATPATAYVPGGGAVAAPGEAP